MLPAYPEPQASGGTYRSSWFVPELMPFFGCLDSEYGIMPALRPTQRSLDRHPQPVMVRLYPHAPLRRRRYRERPASKQR